MRHLFRTFVVLILLVGCARPLDLTQAVTDAQAIVHGVEVALPAFVPFLSPADYTQISVDIAKADGLAATLPAVADQVQQATNVQGVLNLVSGIVNVISTDLPATTPPAIVKDIQELQAVMVLVQVVAPIVAPMVGQRAAGTSVPPVFRSGMSMDQARRILKP